MSQSLIEKVVNAVLYEGYLLYPSRPSVKSRHRWTFGGLYPQAYCDAEKGSDASSMQAECLVRGGRQTALSVEVRFLHLLERRVGRLREPLPQMLPTGEPTLDLVDCLEVGGKLYHPWQEAVERRIPSVSIPLGGGQSEPRQERFEFPGSRQLEPIGDEAGRVVAALVREQEPLAGALETSAARVGDDLFRLTIRIANAVEIDPAAYWKREQVLLRSLVSTHAVLTIADGEFVSILDPPDDARAAAAACRNFGCWPVLVGDSGARHAMLVSPIILYDYPEVAPENTGDLFEATEIDEILNLRILTLTEEEKRGVMAVDSRADAMLERTESLTPEQLLNLHGTVRGLRKVEEGDAMKDSNPVQEQRGLPH